MSTVIPTLVVTRAYETLPSGASDTSLVLSDNDGNAVLHVVNPSGAPVTVVLVPQVTIAGLTIDGPEIVIPAHGDGWIGPLPPASFNDQYGDAYLTDPSGQLVFNALRF